MKKITHFLRSSATAQALVLASLFPSLVLWTPSLQANPAGGIVTGGAAEIGEGLGGHLQIMQHSNRAVIDWASFSIAAGELTQFVQPGADAAVLNRVSGGTPSAIMGALQANGNVAVINTAGILVGPSGTIDVNGLLLSTLDVSNADFMAGGDMLFRGAGDAGVTNMGRINAVGGDVFLLGKTVVNSGTISAANGTVGLAAGEEVLITAVADPAGERVFVRPTAGVGSGTGVDNSGTIEGAMVELKAHGNMYALAINNSGSIRATGATKNGGKVTLRAIGGTISNSGSIAATLPDGTGGRIMIDAGVGGTVNAGGTIDASAKGDGKVGGVVMISGESVTVPGGAQISANGEGGGGFVQIGSGEGVDAQSVAVEAGSSISANGGSGPGGMVVISGGADSNVMVAGAVSATSGSGDGGIIIVEGGDVSVTQSSTLDASGANGGVITVTGENSAVVGGTLRSVGNNGNGGMINISGGNSTTVGPTASIDAGGSVNGGMVSISGGGTTSIAGTVSSVGGSGSGGSIQGLGAAVEMAASARVDASGLAGGGQVNIGGGFQGKDPEIQNATNTTVESGARIAADATGEGGGGTVVVWADHDTLFEGDVNARGAGGGQGGFVEISGRNDLAFRGTVDASSPSGRSGTVLFDPGTVNVGNGASTLPVANVNAILDGNTNVIIATHSGDIIFDNIGDTDDRDISVQWNTDASLGVFASGDVRFLNHARTAGAGSVNVIAGWAGLEGDAILAGNDPEAAWTHYVTGAAAGSFGIDDGDAGTGVGNVYINDSTNNRAVEVGSRYGNTNVAGNDVFVRAGNGVGQYAHLGFKDDGQVFYFPRNRAYAGASDTDPWVAMAGVNENNANTLLATGVNMFNSAGTGGPLMEYSDNFGFSSSGNGNWWWRRLDATVGGSSGIGDNLPEMGAGVSSELIAIHDFGLLESGADINIEARGELVVAAGRGTSSYNGPYAQVGHGGNAHDWTDVGLATETVDPYSVNWGGASSGSGRHLTSAISRLAPVLGDINIRTGLTGSVGGALTVGNAAGGVTLQGGVHSTSNANLINAYTQIGHMGIGQTGSATGNINIESGGAIGVNGGWGWRSSTVIGHVAGAPNYIQEARTGVGLLADTGWTPDGKLGGGQHKQVRVFDTVGTAGVDGFYSNALREGTLATTIPVSAYSGMGTDIYSAGTTAVTGKGADVFTNLHGDIDAVSHNGGVVVDVFINTDPTRRYTEDSSAQIGHGGHINTAVKLVNMRGDINVQALGGGDVSVIAGNGGRAPYAQIGHGGENSGNSATSNYLQGDITLNAEGNLVIEGGGRLEQFGTTNGVTPSISSSSQAYAMVGHGGYDADTAFKTGDIDVTVGGDLTMTSGAYGTTFAQIGHGGYASQGQVGGDFSRTVQVADEFGVDQNFNTTINGTTADITVDVGGNSVLETMVAKSTSAASYVQIGHGGYAARGNKTANVDFSSGGSLTATGGDRDAKYVQVGNGGYDADGNHLGAINVTTLGGDINFDGGSGSYAYGQIGHGGDQSQGNNGTLANLANITVSSAGAITFTGGSLDRASVAIGHGGYDANGDQYGDITVTSVGNIDFTGASHQYAEARIGHGGYAMDGTMEGDILVDAGAGAITFTGGGDSYSPAHIGHGGRSAQGNKAGTIDVSASAIAFLGGAGYMTNARIGHGGNYAGGDFDGNITVDAGVGALSLMGGAGSYAGSLIGHGGYDTRGTVIGAITVDAGDVDIDGGSGTQAFAQIGHGAYNGDSDNSGHIIVTTSTGDVDINGGTATNAYAQIGHGGIESQNAVALKAPADITVTSAGAINLVAGASDRAAAQIGHGGYNADGNYVGNIRVDATDEIDLSGGTGSTSSAIIGHGDQGSAGGSREGDIFVRSPGEISIDSSSGIAWIGHRNNDASPITNADVTIEAASLDEIVGDAPGNIFNVSTAVGNMLQADLAGGDVSLHATGVGGLWMNSSGSMLYTSNQDFNMLSEADVYISNDVINTGLGNVNAVAGWDPLVAPLANPVTGIIAGVDMDTSIFPVVGSFGNNGGDVFVGLRADGSGGATGGGADTGVVVASRTGQTNAAGRDVNVWGYAVTGGIDTGSRKYSQLGYDREDAGTSAALSPTGRIRVGATNDVSLVANPVAIGTPGYGGWTGQDHSGLSAYAHIGHGGDRDSVRDVSMGGDIIVEAGGDITGSGGITRENWTMIGHGGYDNTDPSPSATIGGRITVDAGGNIDFRGGIGQVAFAQIGNGGYNFDLANFNSSTIDVTAVGDVVMRGGTGGGAANGDLAYAQIGHGGIGSSLPTGYSGAITVRAEHRVELAAGDKGSNYVQIGSGGLSSAGNHSGTLIVSAGTDLLMTGVNTADRAAIIGHGATNGASTSVAGDVTVTAGRDATLVNAFVGNVDASYNSGNTWVGVGNDLTADANSRFNSATFVAGSPNDGELRIYLGGADLVDSSARLNGTAHGGIAFPNDQGAANFGAGPYTPPGPTNPVAGNFAYYNLDWQGYYNYIVNGVEAGNIATALGSGEVVISRELGQVNFGALPDFDGGTQYIDVNSAISFSSANDLTFRTTGDINFNARVQNVGAGAVNVAAGWDGTTDAYDPPLPVTLPPGPSNFAAILASGTAWGNNLGMVRLGDGLQTGGIEIGSASGQTNVLGHGIDLISGSDPNERTVIGYYGAGTGDIDVRAKQGGVLLSAGSDVNTFAKIGHGLNRANSIDSGDIAVATSGLVSLTGGGDVDAFAQIGHGGVVNSANQGLAGDTISVAAGTGVLLAAGTGDNTYGLIGNGGLASSNGLMQADVTVTTVAGDIQLNGGSSVVANPDDQFVQIGNTAVQSNSNTEGSITVEALAGTVSLNGGGGFAGQTPGYAQIGNGGWGATGTFHGDAADMIQVSAQDVELLGGNIGEAGYAQIGNGGYNADANAFGSISVAASGAVSLVSGNVNDAYTQIGHGGYTSDGSLQGNVAVAATAGGVTLDSSNGGLRAYAQLGHGGYNSNGEKGGAGETIQVTAADDVELLSGGANFAYAQIGHGGYDADEGGSGSYEAGITVTAGTDGSGSVNLIGSDAQGSVSPHEFAYTQIGHGGYSVRANNVGDVSVSAADDVLMQVGWDRYNYIQIGHGGTGTIDQGAGVAYNGDIDVRAVNGSLTMRRSPANVGGGYYNGSVSYNMVGHGGYVATGNFRGDIAVDVGDSISMGDGILVTTNPSHNFNQIGHGGLQSTGTAEGDIEATAGSDIGFFGGYNTKGYIQIGHGGYGSVNAKSGFIDVVAGQDILLSAFDTNREGRYALIGHWAKDAGSVAGDVWTRAGRDITLTGDALLDPTFSGTTFTGIGGYIEGAATYTGGNTWVEVGRTLTANAYSQFNSAAAGDGGELRFYIGNATPTTGDAVDAGAQLNGVAHGAALFPNAAGQYTFGLGPYPAPAPTVAGNFAYYTPDWAGYYNYEIGLAEAGNIGTALGSSEVVISRELGQVNFGALPDVDGGTQYINVNSVINFTSANELTFRTTGDITFNAGVQNAGAGAVNVAAGWDGTTDAYDPPLPVVLPPGASNFASILGDDASWGNNSGMVRVGDGLQGAGIAVGSRSGQSNVLGYGISLNAGTASNSYSQIGFRTVDAGSDTIGGITVYGKEGGLTMSGGTTGSGAYAQVGHGGHDGAVDVDSTLNGDILVDLTRGAADGDLAMTASSGFGSIAMIGHGGSNLQGTKGGAISVAAGDIGITGGRYRAAAQIGHGGYNADGDYTGNIVVNATGDINVQGGEESTRGDNSAQIGHGGVAVNGGSFMGTIDVTSGGDISFAGAGGGGSSYGSGYAQLGHSGGGAVTNADITVAATGGITFAGGSELRAFAQLGHGGYEKDGNKGGNINVTAGAGGIDFDGGAGSYSYAQIGNGGGETQGDHSGAIVVGSGGTIDFTGGTGTQSFAQIGHGGYNADGDHSGSIGVTAATDLAASSGSGNNAYAQIGHGGYGASGQLQGNLAVTATAGGVTLDSSSGGSRAYAQLGHGGYGSKGDKGGVGQTIQVTAANNVALLSGGSDRAYAQIGHGGYDADADAGDDTGHVAAITVTAGSDGTGSVILRGSGIRDGHDDAATQIGNGGYSARGDHAGSVTVTAADSVELQGGRDVRNFVQIGHGGYDADGFGGGVGHTGAVSVTATNGSVILNSTPSDTSGGYFNAYSSYLLVGHGGYAANDDHNGNITVTAGDAVTLSGGLNDNNFKQIGHGGRASNGDFSGSIAVTAENDIFLQGGTNDYTYAQIGHGGHIANGDHSAAFLNVVSNSGAITVEAGRRGANGGTGDGKNAYAQIGLGGGSSSGTMAAPILVQADGDIVVEGGGRQFNYAQIGNGGYDADGDKTGSIGVTASNGRVRVLGAALQQQAYAQIGHGGALVDGVLGGAVTVAGNTGIDVLARNGLESYAQIGHGGGLALGDTGGAITLMTSGEVDLTGGGNIDAYSQIGHGGRGNIGNHGVAADVIRVIANSLDFNGGTSSGAYAQLGNGGHNADGTFAGDVLVNLDPLTGLPTAGGGALTMDAGSGDDAYVQIGHGGANDNVGSNGKSGDVAIGQIASVTMSGGSGIDAFAQIGHGGDENDGAATGSVVVNSGGLVGLSGGSGDDGYVQIGHGGHDATGDFGAAGGTDLLVVVGNGIDLDGGTVADGAYAQIGFGGRNADGNHAGAVFINYDPILTSGPLGGGTITLDGGASGTNAYAQIGHGGTDNNTGAKAGGILFGAVSSVSLGGGAGMSAYAQVGHGGRSATGSMSGDITVTTVDGVTMDSAAGKGEASFTQIGHGGYQSNGTLTGSLTVTGSDAAAAVILNGGDNKYQYSQIGHGGYDTDGAKTGVLTVAAGSGGVHLSGGGDVADAITHLNSNARIGHGGSGSGGTHSGTIDVTTVNGGDVTLKGGADRYTHAQIGHGGRSSAGSLQSGDITVTSDGLVSIIAAYNAADPNGEVNGNAGETNAQIGHGGMFAGGTYAGTINVNAQTGVFISNGESTFNFARIGHGGYRPGTGSNPAFEIVDADIMVSTVSGGVILDAYQPQTYDYNLVQIGHGGVANFSEPRNQGAYKGNITVNGGTGNVEVLGGTGKSSSAQIGHGGIGVSGNHEGVIDVRADGDLVMQTEANGAGVDYRRYSRIGHGGATDDPVESMVGNMTGDITVDMGGDVTLDASLARADNSYVQIGHGGTEVDGDFDGAITVVADGAAGITLLGGVGAGTYAQIGHGGYSGDGDRSNDVTVTSTVGDVTISGGSGANAYAQVGHGGAGGSGNMSGKIDLQASRDVLLTGVDASDQYAMVGHGHPAMGGTAADDVWVRAGRNVTLTNGFVGHRTGTYTGGNTWLGVGRTLTADAASQFNSAAAVDGGELRFYIGNATPTTGDAVNAATLLNGVAHGAALFPNAAGQFTFGNGPYPAPAPTVAGNFAYYTPAWAGYYNYEIGLTEAGNIGTALGGSEVIISRELGQLNFGALPDVDGGTQYINVNSAINFSSANDLTFRTTGDITFNAGVQNAGSGAVNVAAGWDGTTDAYDPPLPVTLPPGASNFASIMGSGTAWGNNNGRVTIGDGLQAAGIAVGSHSGASNVLGYGVSLNGGAAANTYSHAGYRGTGASGDILVRAKDGGVALSGGSNTSNYAQVGHGGLNQNGNTQGDIWVDSTSSVQLTGGTGHDAYTQIGHGGHDNRADHGTAADRIVVIADSGITLTGGDTAGTNYGSYAQIGNGGYDADGALSGDVYINYDPNAGAADGGGNLTLVGSPKVTTEANHGTYAHIGHGGRHNVGTKSGDITVGAVDNVSLTSGQYRSYTQIGHGGQNSTGTKSGVLSIDASGDLSLTGGAGQEAYSQIGHGGHQGDGTTSGGLTLAVGGLVDLDGGSGSGAYAQIGHGGYGDNLGGTRSGDISISGATDVTLDGGGGSAAYVQIGHGGYGALVNSSALVNIEGSGNLTLTGSGSNAYAQIGHGGGTATGTVSDAHITADVVGMVDLDAGAGGSAYAQIGHGGYGTMTMVETTSNILLNTAAGSGTGDLTLDGNGVNSYAQIGHGGARSDTTVGSGEKSGDITIGQAANVALASGAGIDGYTQIGHGGEGGSTTVYAGSPMSGDLSITTSGDLSLTGGSSDDTYSQIGHGGDASRGDTSGDITLGISGAAVLNAGSGTDAYVQIGHGGHGGLETNNHGAAGDEIKVIADSLDFNGGSGSGAYAQLGNGGYLENGTFSGDILVNLDASGLPTAGGGALTMDAGTNTNTYVQIGHGGANVNGNSNAKSGDVVVGQIASVTMNGGSGTDTFAQIGHGGDENDGAASGSVVVNSAGLVQLGGGSGNDSYVQIGHGGHDATGDFGAAAGNDLLVVVGNGIDLDGGTVADGAYAQIGFGGRNADGNHAGAVFINYDPILTNAPLGGGAITLDGGASGTNAYAQIGHGGNDSNIGTKTGNILVGVATDVSLDAGAGDDSYVQIGHGGQAASGDATADITIDLSGSMNLTAGNSAGSYGYAHIGNGGMGATGTHSGAINIVSTGAGGTLDLLGGGTGGFRYAQIGHGGAGTVSSNNGDGDDVIAVTFGGDISLLGGSFNNASAQIGMGGLANSGIHRADISVTSNNGSVVVTGNPVAGGNSDDNYAQIGNGGAQQTSTTRGNITVSALNGMVTLTAGGGEAGGGSETPNYAQIGNGGHENRGNHGDGGETILVDAQGVVLLGGTTGAGESYAQIGNGGFGATGSHRAMVKVLANAGDITATAGTTAGSYVQIGNGGMLAAGNHSGVVSARASGNIIFAGNGAADTYAQFGHGGRLARGDHSGRLEMLAQSIAFSGGGGTNAYAQYGHGGHDADAGTSASVGNSGDMSMAATTGNISFSGGAGSQAYAQLGHGGYDTTGANSGNVVARSGGDFLLTPGTGAGAYAQAGHGGANAAGDTGHTGSLTISAGTFASDLQFTGVVANRNYTDVFDVNGDGVIDALDVVNITNNTAVGVRVGATAPGGAAGAGAYSQIGHGGMDAHGDHGAAPVSDGLRVESTAGLYVYGGGAADASAQIGHGGQNVVGNLNGRIYTASEDALVVQGGTSDRAFAQIGLGGLDDVAGAGDIEGDKDGMIVAFSRLGDVNVLANSGAGAYGQIGHGGLNNDGNFLHEDLGLFVQAGWDTTAGPPAPAAADLLVSAAGAGPGAYGMIGSGDSGLNPLPTPTSAAGTGDRIGLVFTNSTGNTTDNGVIGHQTGLGTILSTGSVNLTAGDYTIGTTGTYKETGAQVAGRVVTADYMVGAGGSIFVNEDVSFASGNDLTLAARDNILVNASIQNSQAAGGGSVNLIAGWDEVTGLGVDPFIYVNTPPAGRTFDAALVEADPLSYGIGDGITQGLVRIGDGSQARELAVGSRSGTTRVLGHTLALNAGAGNGDYARIGFQTSAGNTSASGAIKVAMKGAIALAAGPVAGSHAQIGHGATYLAGGTLGGDISVVSEGLVPLSDITLTGGAGLDNFAQVGHGGVQNTADKGGSILVRTGDGDVLLTSGAGEKGYSQVGHGGVNAGAPSTQGGAADLVEVDASGSVTLRASDGGLRAYSQIGNGGFNADAPTTAGDVRVIAGDTVTVIGGAAQQAYAQVGHGGGAADGDKSGVLIVEAGDGLMAGSVALSRGAGSDAYAKIGHGDQAFTSGAVGSASGTIDGGIQVTAGEGMVSTGGMVGHVDPGIGGPAVAGSGSTFVAVSRNDFPATMMSGDGTLVADAASVFSSGAGGELRFYMPRRDSNQVAVGASLNGTAYIGGLSDPALQRSDEFYTSLGQHTNLNTAAANAAGLVLNLDPVDAANYSTALGDYSFYFDTGTLTPAPDGGGGGGEEVAPPAPPAPPIFVTIDGQLFFNRGVFGPGSPYVQVGPYAVGFTDDYFNWDAQRYELDMYDSGDKRGWGQGGPWTSTFEAAFSKVEGGAGWSSFTVFGDPDFTVGGYGFGFDGINNPPEMDDELRRMLEALEAELAELRGGE